MWPTITKRIEMARRPSKLGIRFISTSRIVEAFPNRDSGLLACDFQNLLMLSTAMITRVVPAQDLTHAPFVGIGGHAAQVSSVGYGLSFCRMREKIIDFLGQFMDRIKADD